jgi:hypothetical protein
VTGFLRSIERSDENQLAWFECADAARPHELEVQEGVRDALTWIDDADGIDREVLVYEEDREIVAVVMHEDDDGDRFINALAVRRDRQGERIGTRVFVTLLTDLGERFPGRVATWLVAPANFASHALADRVGAEPIHPPETKPNALYTLELG